MAAPRVPVYSANGMSANNWHESGAYEFEIRLGPGDWQETHLLLVSIFAPALTENRSEKHYR